MARIGCTTMVVCTRPYHQYLRGEDAEVTAIGHPCLHRARPHILALATRRRPRSRRPLWRAAQIFRLASFCYALGFQIVVNHDLDRPGLTWALFGLLAVANIWWAAGYLVGFGRRWWFVASEVAVSAVMMLSTSYVATWLGWRTTRPGRRHSG